MAFRLAKRLAWIAGVKVIAREASQATVELTRDKLYTLNNALNEVCHGPSAIEGWEFQTRMSVECSEAEALLDEIHALLA